MPICSKFSNVTNRKKTPNDIYIVILWKIANLATDGRKWNLLSYQDNKAENSWGKLVTKEKKLAKEK